MSRKEMIASLEAACKALDEKKKSLEQVIMALRQEEAAAEGEQVQDGQERGDQSDDGGTEELELSDASADF
jgi:peptidoglycan hydrolase CwlO-like protein